MADADNGPSKLQAEPDVSRDAEVARQLAAEQCEPRTRRTSQRNSAADVSRATLSQQLAEQEARRAQHERSTIAARAQHDEHGNSEMADADNGPESEHDFNSEQTGGDMEMAEAHSESESELHMEFEMEKPVARACRTSTYDAATRAHYERYPDEEEQDAELLRLQDIEVWGSR